MNTELLRRILDDARDNAANPSAAMAIEDLMRDVQDIDTLLLDYCLEEIPGLIDETRNRADTAEKEACAFGDLVESLASVTTDAEMDEGMPGDEAVSLLSDYVDQARALVKEHIG